MPDLENGPLPEFIGKRVDPTYSKILQKRLKDLLHTPNDSFPGSQPVSFESRHLNDIEREDYFVCEKSDGVRYLLFIVHSPKGPASFLYDRNRYWYYIPNLLFPIRGRDNEHLKDTLIDGELVLDIDEKKKTWRYLIFDLMVINGSTIIQRSFNTRLGMLQQDVIQPFHSSLRNVTDANKLPPFTVELKKMERSYGLHLVFEQIPKLKHKSDGIVWTPVKCPYTSGTCEKLLKWKPPELNTVDFRIAARWSKEHKPIYSIEVLSHGVTYKFYDHFQPEPTLATEWKSHLPDGRIAEFRYDSEWEVTIIEQGYAPIVRKGGWRFVRFRDDKGTANDENAVKRILNSIRDGVTKEQLLACMDRVRAAWKAREKGLPMPPLPSSKSSSNSAQNINNTSLPPTPTTSKPSHSLGRPGSKPGSISEESDHSGTGTKRKASVASTSSAKKEDAEDFVEEKQDQKKIKLTAKGETTKTPVVCSTFEHEKTGDEETVDSEDNKAIKPVKDIVSNTTKTPEQRPTKEEDIKTISPKPEDIKTDLPRLVDFNSASSKLDESNGAFSKLDNINNASKPEDVDDIMPKSEETSSVMPKPGDTTSVLPQPEDLTSVLSKSKDIKETLPEANSMNLDSKAVNWAPVTSPIKKDSDLSSLAGSSKGKLNPQNTNTLSKHVFITASQQKYQASPSQRKKVISTPEPSMSSPTKPTKSASMLQSIVTPPIESFQPIQQRQKLSCLPNKRHLDSNAYEKAMGTTPVKSASGARQKKALSSSSIANSELETKRPMVSFVSDRTLRNAPTSVSKATNKTSSAPSILMNSETRMMQQGFPYSFDPNQPSTSRTKYIPGSPQDISSKPMPSSSLNIHKLLTTSVEPITSSDERVNYRNTSGDDKRYSFSQTSHPKKVYTEKEAQLQRHYSLQPQPPYQIQHEQSPMSYHQQQQQQQHSQYLQKHIPKTSQPPVQFINFHAERRPQQGSAPNKDEFLIFQSEGQPPIVQPRSKSYSSIWKTNNAQSEQLPTYYHPYQAPQQTKKQDEYTQQLGYEQQVAHQPSSEKPKDNSIKSKLDFILN